MYPFPILDIRVWRRDPARFAAELRRACHQLGFFQLRHDVPSGLVDDTVRAARRFFALPHSEKLKCDYARSPAFRGYMRVGVENTAGAPDMREQFEIAAEGEPASSSAWPPHERLRGANQWPAALPELRDSVERYAEAMLSLSAEVTDALRLALGLEPGALDELFAAPGTDPAPHWQMKLASYSPSGGASAAGGGGGGGGPTLGVGAHTDSGWLTMLLQDDVGGLQAFTQGGWADVPPAGPGVVVVNLGEVAEVASGGYLLATPHRVLSSSAARLSVPFFYNPRLDAHVRPLIQFNGTESARHRHTQTHWRRPSNALLPEYGANAFKSLARSHPAVFAEHHPDLTVLDEGRVVRREDRT